MRAVNQWYLSVRRPPSVRRTRVLTDGALARYRRTGCSTGTADDDIEAEGNEGTVDDEHSADPPQHSGQPPNITMCF